MNELGIGWVLFWVVELIHGLGVGHLGAWKPRRGRDASGNLIRLSVFM